MFKKNYFKKLIGSMLALSLFLSNFSLEVIARQNYLRVPCTKAVGKKELLQKLFIKSGELSIEHYLKLTEEEKQILRKEFFEALKSPVWETDEDIPYIDEPPSVYPLTDDKMIEKLVKSSKELSIRYPSDKIFSLGRSPLWFIKTAELLDRVPGKYGYIAFSGKWFHKDNQGQFVSNSAGPDNQQINIYRKYLSELGLDPKSIGSRPTQTVIVEYTKSGESLASFLSLMVQWAKELQMEQVLRNKIVIHILQDPLLEHIDHILDFDLHHQEVDHELIRDLGNSHNFLDSLGMYYPFWGWATVDPLNMQISNNSKLVYFRIVDFLMQQVWITENRNAGLANKRPLQKSVTPNERKYSNFLRSL